MSAPGCVLGFMVGSSLSRILTPQWSRLIILALFPTIAAITGMHLAEIEDVPYQVAFFEAVGVITTGGLSAGVIDFDTDPATKIVLGFLMIFGRLEIIAIIYIFVPRLS